MPNKCDYICVSATELEALRKGCGKPAKKRTVAKPKKAVSKPKKAVARTRTVKATPKAVRTVKKKKNVNKNKNINTNTNTVSVNVSTNPRATSNVYIVRPSEPVAVSEPRRKVRKSYDAPFLPRRDYNGVAIPQAPSSGKTVYIERSAPAPEIIVDSEPRPRRSIGASAKKVLSAGSNALRNVRGSRSEIPVVEVVDYPTALKSGKSSASISSPKKSSAPALPSPKAEVLPADYELPKNTKKI